MNKSTTTKPKAAFGLLLVGPPKSGKTCFALQFPNPYIIDCDNNLSGPHRYLSSKGSVPEYYYDVVDIDPVTQKEILPHNAWTRLTELAKKAVVSPEVDTIIIDSLSKVNDYLVNHILHTEKQTNMRIQDWLPYNNLMKKFITFLRSSGKLIILCAHETVIEDEMDKIPKYFVAMQSSLKYTIGGLFTDVWRAEFVPGSAGKDGTYSIRAIPTVRMSLGNSLGLPPVFPMDFVKEVAPKLNTLLT